MLVTLELSERQAARVLAQAIRTHVKVEVEPRPETHNALLWGSFSGQENDLLQVDLHDSGPQVNLSGLVGAMCDVRMILSGQLCMFSTFVVDASNEAVPKRITLATPTSIQMANRRRFARKTPTEPVPVRISVPGYQPPFVAILTNIGPQGLGCRVVSRDLDEVLYIGDRVHLEFVLPWSNDAYSVAATTCNKNPCGEDGHMIVGFEFVHQPNETQVERLRTALNDETARLTEQDGAP